MFFETQVGYLAELSGLPDDGLRHLICFLLAYPIGQAFKLLPNIPVLKHIVNISIGLFFVFFSFANPFTFVHLLISSTLCYIIAMSSFLGNPYARAKIIFVFAMVYVSICHIYRMYWDWGGWEMDHTGMQMVFTLKVTAFGFNLADGYQLEQSKKKDSKVKPPSDEMIRRSINKLPNLLEFYGWVYFYPTLLVGPKIEIKDYLNYMDMTQFDDGKIPSTIAPSLFVLLKAIAFMPITILADNYLVQFLATDDFKATPVLFKLFYLWRNTALYRFKYYFAWYLTEGGCVSCGIGYKKETIKKKDEKTGKEVEETMIRWDRFKNMQWLKVEVPENCRGLIHNWNMGTQDWMANYIYNRVKNRGTLFATILTMSVSAFWHGFYPGYYLFFIMLGVVNEVAKYMRRVLRPMFMKQAKPLQVVYDIIGRVLTVLTLAYIGSSFLILDFWPAIEIYKGCYFIGHLLIFGAFGLFMTLASMQKKPTRNPKSGKGVTKEETKVESSKDK
eukprot:TRINITY_DN995_c0_g2_i1.p1 TRINITY_DN995_c0_g2~~TRINITY_DN995_c0_g2_i1.p1  ORF type:complete len:501 (-),score=134.73 TRINITY_DN995_c0_g2_i1:180-1682(-)